MEWLHDTRHEMFEQLWSWFDSSLDRIRAERAIRTLSLPNPSEPTTDLAVGLVDPSTVSVILGYAHNGGRYAAGAYVGLIAQDPMCAWRGLTGFFVAWCQGCDPEGDQTFKGVQRDLRTRGIRLRSIWDLPAAIHPQAGWFDGERLQFGALVNRRVGVDEFWGRAAQFAPDGPALLATGPVITSLANLVLVDRLKRDLPQLAKLRPNPALWAVRTGRHAALAELAAIPPDPVRPAAREVRSRGDIPPAWGAFSDGSGGWTGPVPNLREFLQGRTFRGNEPVSPLLSIAHLPPGRAARLSDILALARV